MQRSPSPVQQQSQSRGRHIPTDENFMEYAVRVSFADFLDELVVVILRDARIFVGRLVSFDHFLNLVVDQTYERIIVGNKYAEVKRGVFVIRGENVVHIGLVEREQFDELTKKNLELVEKEEIFKLYREQEANKKVNKLEDF